MPLTGDQRALIKLVVERGQSFADIASMTGESEDDVAVRARRALAAAAGVDLDRDAALTDYLLGQGDPISRADAVRHISRDPAARQAAEAALAAIEEVAPDATLPSLPEVRPSKPKPAPGLSAEAARRAPIDAAALSSPLGTPQRRLVALVSGVALALVVVVVLILGGGDDATGPDDAEIDPDFVQVELDPAAGSNATGRAVIGQTDDDQPFIQLDLTDLGQIGAGNSYVLWMLTDRETGIPVSPIAPTDGEFHDRLPLLSPADLVAAFSRNVVIAVMDSAKVQETLNQLLTDFGQQNADSTSLPVTRYNARTILQGRIPTLAEATEEAPQGGEDANREAEGSASQDSSQSSGQDAP